MKKNLIFNIVDIKLEFKDYIDDLCLPFLNKNSNIFYDFIKYNCYNLDIVKNKVENENKEYLKELEEMEENEFDYDER